MLKRGMVSTAGIVLSLSMFSTMPVSAQLSTGLASLPGVNQHHQVLAVMMKDMAQEMSEMSEQMRNGDPGPGQRKQMMRRMERMSQVMRLMSGLEARSFMKEADMQKALEQMRKQMDEMMRDPAMIPSSKH